MPRDHVAATSGVGAGRASVRLLTCMRALVGRQVVGAGEHLPAGGAGVRLDAAVQTGVPGQHVGASEAAATDLALVSPDDVRCPLPVPRGHVFGQPVVHGESLPASVTHVPGSFMSGFRSLRFQGQI